MASIFSREPDDKKPLDPYSRERIEKEIEHLKKKRGTRDAGEQNRKLGIWVTVLAILALLVLFFMDPVVYSWERGNAINAYLYLHNFGREEKAQALANCGILSRSDVDTLNHRQGSFQDFFPTPKAAADTADGIVRYMKGAEDLRERHYDKLDVLGKIRYQLFVRWGLVPPSSFDMINPSTDK